MSKILELQYFIHLDFWNPYQLAFTYLESTMEASMCKICEICMKPMCGIIEHQQLRHGFLHGVNPPPIQRSPLI